MKMYSSVASTSIPLRVDYLCCFCEQENTDEDQYVELKAQSHGSIAPSPKLDSEARERLMEKYASTLQEVEQGNYRAAYLTCTCKACGKRQPWASYIRAPVWTIVLFVLGIVLMLFALSRRDEIIISPRLLILPAMLVPFIVIELLNWFTTRKVSRLDAKHLPRVTIRKT